MIALARLSATYLSFACLVSASAPAMATKAAASQEPIQWSRGTGGNGHWYQRVTTPESINWNNAEAAARAAGGSLVTVDSVAEQNWILANLVIGLPACPSADGGPDRAIWIGLRQCVESPTFSEPAGGWEWIGGGPVTYFNWTAGRPDDVPARSDYGGMSITGEWEDFTNDAGEDCFVGYVVEWSDDCDGNGTVDFGEIMSAGTSVDQNSNSVLDVCERAFGDVNLDGDVDALDLAALLAEWGPCDDTNGCTADLNSDGAIDAGDLANLLAFWGATPPWIEPIITSISPSSGPEVGGTTVTISGVRLSGTTSVTIGGVVATSIAVLDSTRVTAMTPAGAPGPKLVQLHTPDGTASFRSGFSYVATAPTISSVTPNSGPTTGGTFITISGTNLTADTLVTIGGVPATSVTVAGPQSISAITPAGTAGAKSVSVTSPTGTAQLAGGFVYVSVPIWATLLEALPDPAAVPSPAARSSIVATGHAWRIRDVATLTEMVLVPPGPFNMGCSASIGSNCSPDEIPVHSVTLSGAFYLGRYEVTQRQWVERMGSNPSWFQLASVEVPAMEVLNRPVERVSWEMLQGYLVGTGLRLPSEAEWEYAYRAGTDTAFHGFTGVPDGTNDGGLASAIAWFGSNSVDQTRPVGKKLANGLGLYDMAGNVSEWVNDWWSPLYYAGSPPTDPAGPANGVYRVIRGGSWSAASSANLRASVRGKYTPEFLDRNLGFRVARSAVTTSQAPTITMVTPDSGPSTGGTTILISGTKLNGTSSVMVGGMAATSVEVVSPTEVTAVTPAGSPGPASVGLITPGGTASLASGFTYSVSPPIISSVTPNSGPSVGGTSITISGENLTGVESVMVGETPATAVVVVNPATLTAMTPAGTVGTATVTVTTASGSVSLAKGFTYILPAPTISSVTPNSGPMAGGTPIIVSGTNLNGASSVTVDGAAATSVTFVNATTVAAITPSGSLGPKSVAITTPGGTATLPNGFAYIAPAPSISSVMPNSGPTVGGTSITISGTNLAGVTSVTIGGTPATAVTVASSTVVTATTPSGTIGPKSVSVTTPGGTASLDNGFNYLPAPTVTSVAPASGPTTGGMSITISGTNLIGTTSVTIGGAAATAVAVVNAETLMAVTPPGSVGPKIVSVTTSGGTASLPSGFTYFAPAPTISSVTPNSGPTTGGTTITLGGTNLIGTTSVTVGGAAATSVTILSPTTVTAVTPAGSVGAKPLSLITPGGTASLSNAFTYVVPAPTISTVTPNSGPVAGGTTIAIFGSNLSGTSAVSVGGVAATSVNVVNSTTVTAVTPPGMAGVQTVSIATPGGTANLSSGFVYIPAPTISSLSPNVGPATGGTTITIFGTNLSGTSSVTVGGVAATGVVVANSTTVTAVTPPGSAGAKTVTLTTTPGGTASLAGAFTYFAQPTLSSITPSLGLTTGGTTITLVGTNLTGALSVTLGGAVATSLTVVNASTVTVVTPVGTVGAKTVLLTTPGGAASLTNGFTYTSWPCTVLTQNPDPSVVVNATLRTAITATGLPWRVRDDVTGIEMLLVPPGNFNMGCSASSGTACSADESPIHDVMITDPFYIGRYEVTQAQWTTQVGSNPSSFQSASVQVPAAQVPNRPVESVSWTMVQNFLSSTGLRLPKEAEWEYAYRAGTTTAFHSMPNFPGGSNDEAQVGSIAWFSSNSSNQTRVAGQKGANALGIHDMSGNVWEWVADWYSSAFYAGSSSSNPAGPSSGTSRVRRGGSFSGDAGAQRASDRESSLPDSSSANVGFRVAKNP